MTDTPYILQALADGVTTLALNRPESRNALSIGMLQALNRALADIAKDPATRVVIIRGEGPAFCAGHDLKEMRSTDFAKTGHVSSRVDDKKYTSTTEARNKTCARTRSRKASNSGASTGTVKATM